MTSFFILIFVALPVIGTAQNEKRLDLYYSNEPKWVMESIDVAFQMDGNFAQQPYNVWLDKVTLKAF